MRHFILAGFTVRMFLGATTLYTFKPCFQINAFILAKNSRTVTHFLLLTLYLVNINVRVCICVCLCVRVRVQLIDSIEWDN